MSKTVVRDGGTKLSHARLYLDDLFEIEGIISEAFAKLENSPSIRFEYEIDRKLKVTTHEDLKDHEGFSFMFTMNVVSDSLYFNTDYGVLRFYSTLSPEFSAPHALGDERWATFGKIESVFKSRQDKFKTTCEAMPFLPFLAAVVSLPILSLVATRNGFTHFADNAGFTDWLLAAVILVIGFGQLRKNGIYLRDAREDQKERTKNRNERIEKLIFLVVGALLGATLGTAGTMWITHLKH
jgi:hypothetical protein